MHFHQRGIDTDAVEDNMVLFSMVNKVAGWKGSRDGRQPRDSRTLDRNGLFELDTAEKRQGRRYQQARLANKKKQELTITTTL